jgi:hypothetical protein
VQLSFIYNLRSRYLNPLADRFEELGLKEDDLFDILAAERSGSRELKKDGDSGEERRLIEKIRLISRPHPGPKADRSKPPELLSSDALMLARFLAQKGLKVEGEKT